MEQLSIFDHIKKVQRMTRPKQSTAGSFDIAKKMRESMVQAMKNCTLSVDQIAGEMSHLTSSEITKTTIYSWTRMTKSDGSNEPNDRHIPAEWLPAFCHVTGSNEPILIQGAMVRLVMVPEPHALEAEIRKEEAKLKKQQLEIKRRKALLAEITGKAMAAFLSVASILSSLSR